MGQGIKIALQKTLTINMTFLGMELNPGNIVFLNGTSKAVTMHGRSNFMGG
jgi:hypothetical protein